MSLAVVIGVGLVGGAGAIARFALDGGVEQLVGGTFPYGTLVVNLLGSFVLGMFAGLTLTGQAAGLLGTGLIGAFTTFSTWMFETHRLGEDQRTALATINILLSLALGVAAAWLGRRLGVAL